MGLLKTQIFEIISYIDQCEHPAETVFPHFIFVYFLRSLKNDQNATVSCEAVKKNDERLSSCYSHVVGVAPALSKLTVWASNKLVCPRILQNLTMNTVQQKMLVQKFIGWQQ